MKNYLFIMAAGQSSRMGGTPKHLCTVPGFSDVKTYRPNLGRTIDLTSELYDRIYVVIDRSTLSIDSQSLTECICSPYKNVKILDISSGKGDADAILQAFNEVADEGIERAVVCWGDTFFYSKELFEITNSLFVPKESFIVCPCRFEKSPYAYFDIDARYSDCEQGKMYTIKDSVFKDDEKYSTEFRPEYTAHDQSLFLIDVEAFKENAQIYGYALKDEVQKIELKMAPLKNHFKIKLKSELSLLKMISWLAHTDLYIKSPKAQMYVINDFKANISWTWSFNTPEELNALKLSILENKLN